jgi:hypothetical protein
MGKTSLLMLVQDTVAGADWPQKDAKFTLDEEQSFPSRLLMTLELYCYAKGVLSSENIATAVRTDPALRGLFPGACPLDGTIQKFRRRHHQDIKRCLLSMFDTAFKVRFGDPAKDEAPIDYCVAVAFDRWFEPMCGPQPDKEAEERLGLAVFWDGMSTT